MKILITNDDGINARGIIALAKEISKKHEIIVVAPREQKSASSHSISIHNPIKIREEKLDENFKAYSLVGTPADCTQAGLSLLGGDIDIVISGINRGLNCGTDILYSGTVSAAVEGAIYSVPSIAISMDVDWSKEDEDYSKAAKWISKILDVAEKDYLKENVVLNVNVPNINEEDIKGLKVCRLGKSTYKTNYILVEENEDKVYVTKGTRNDILEDDSDLYFLSQGYVTLTPLHFDFTNFKILDEVKDIFEDKVM
ncbi:MULTISPECIES: 5'/3'-nucleotidase SurE [Clostridium]|jgi:5'-nucleotidase|uniref:5'-nucleotidase SurE n=1 Tax=Clostridium tertium TaxID=1559 RepID=A0A9X3XMN9_9CLOT|nr:MULTISPECIES: 5'/3'-nucleotidase SurE [Clostridium]MBS5305459.1 5'/3'-nucleotidase SurE [Clostridium sp.]MBS6502942.1 5'/3'-nucleotidase SurE [Clostridium sp.]MDB1943203.1 5'/3'-nucleotidase SurE [Clostridium tertium]MDB1950304.1 5'/3'-nucleotidase SurE [Clostridium tertium]MDB1969921.1 5'/3'-nucleotidase SurE [Clostridium tertium]